ncbi:MAG: hypothetical protein QOF29_1623, partial [bacterium]
MSAAAALIEVAQGRAAPGAVVIGGRVADVYAGEFVAANVDDPRLLQAIAATRATRRRAEGHAAGASYDRLAALAAAGIGSDHEAITAAEARGR